MRTKATLFLVVLVLALLGIAYYAKQNPSSGLTTAETKLVFPNETVNIDYIEISFADRPTRVILERQPTGWELVEPVRWPANRFAVSRLLTQLQYLERVNSFLVSSLAGDRQSLADYSLDPPEGLLVLGRDETRRTVRIGRITEASNRLYLLPEDGDRIIVVEGTVRDTLRLTPDELRSPVVFNFQFSEVRSWNLQLAEAGNLRIFVSRDGDRWKLETPVEARASRTNVETLLNRILALRVHSFIPPGQTDLNLVGLASPRFRITVEGSARRETMLLGDPVPGGEAAKFYYAKLEDTPGRDHTAVFVVAVDFLDQLRSAQLDLRERRVLEFEPAAVQSLRIAAAGQPEITLQLLENDRWQVSSRSPDRGLITMPGDAATISALLEEFAELRSIPNGGFVSDAAPDADLERYGLTGATAWQITLTERPVDGARDAEPRSQTLHFGRTADRDGRPVYARLADKRFVYLVDRALVDDLSSRAIDYRSRQILQVNEGLRITSLTLTNLGTKAVVFSGSLASLTQSWSDALAAEPAARRDAGVALVKELRDLRARTIEHGEFTAFLPGDSDRRAWTWLLQAVITNEAGATTQSTTFALYLDDFVGGSVLLMAAPDPGLIFTAPQSFIDAFGPLVFSRPEPGIDPGVSVDPTPVGPDPAEATLTAAPGEPDPVPEPPADR